MRVRHLPFACAAGLLLATSPARAASSEPTAAEGPAVTSDGAESAARDLLTPSVGFGWSSEQGVGDEALHFRISIEARHAFSSLLFGRARVRDHFYRRQYLIDRPAMDGPGLSRADLDEQKLDVDAALGVDLGQAFGFAGSPLRLCIAAGPSLRLFLNDVLPARALGPAVELEAGYALSPAVELVAGAGYAHNIAFSNRELLSPFGGPRSLVSLRGGLFFSFPPGARVAFTWDGELLQLERSTRQYHSLSLLLELPL